MKTKNDKINKQLSKVIAAKKLYKNHYSKQSPLLSRLGAQVLRENERELKKMVR